MAKIQIMEKAKYYQGYKAYVKSFPHFVSQESTIQDTVLYLPGYSTNKPPVNIFLFQSGLGFLKCWLPLCILYFIISYKDRLQSRTEAVVSGAIGSQAFPTKVLRLALPSVP